MGAIQGEIRLGKSSQIEHESPIRLVGPIRIRYSLRIGFYSYILGPARIGRIESIGRYCSIAPGLTAGLSSHPTDWLSTSTIQYTKSQFDHGDWHEGFKFTRRTPETDPTKAAPPITIGNDVWIGANVTLLNGITIGDGAIIAAGCVVTKSVPPYAIVAGVPAKVLRMRFDDKTIQRLQASKWWRFDARVLSGLPFHQPLEALDLLQAKVDAGEVAPVEPGFQVLKIPAAKKKDVAPKAKPAPPTATAS